MFDRNITHCGQSPRPTLSHLCSNIIFVDVAGFRELQILCTTPNWEVTIKRLLASPENNILIVPSCFSICCQIWYQHLIIFSLELVICGVGYHHAGLDSSDRKTVEALFTKGDLPVLCKYAILYITLYFPSVFQKSVPYPKIVIWMRISYRSYNRRTLFLFQLPQAHLQLG